jgi:hypothetical protein
MVKYVLKHRETVFPFKKLEPTNQAVEQRAKVCQTHEMYDLLILN